MPGHSQPKEVVGTFLESKVLVLGYAVSAGLDTATTAAALSRGLSEGNPVVLELISLLGIPGLVVGKLAALVLAGAVVSVADHPKKLTKVSLLLFTIIYGTAAVYNSVVIYLLPLLPY